MSKNAIYQVDKTALIAMEFGRHFSNLLSDSVKSVFFVNFIKELTEKDFNEKSNKQGNFLFFVKDGKLFIESGTIYTIADLYCFSVHFKIEPLANMVVIHYRNANSEKWIRFSFSGDVLLGEILQNQILQITEILENE